MNKPNSSIGRPRMTLVETLRYIVGNYDDLSEGEKRSYNELVQVLRKLDEFDAATNAPYSEYEYEVWNAESNDDYSDLREPMQ